MSCRHSINLKSFKSYNKHAKLIVINTSIKYIASLYVYVKKKLLHVFIINSSKYVFN